MNQSGLNLRVLNLSWGSAATSAALHAAILHANTVGILVVAGAGNNSQDNDGPVSFYPASDPSPTAAARKP